MFAKKIEEIENFETIRGSSNYILSTVSFLSKLKLMRQSPIRFRVLASMKVVAFLPTSYRCGSHLAIFTPTVLLEVKRQVPSAHAYVYVLCLK
jgi:hypothetical protein